MSMDPQKSEDDTDEMNITVAVRCRGRNEREIKAKSSVIVSVPDVMGSNEISINTSDDLVSGITAQLNSKTYTVDKAFGPSANQKLIFQEIAEPLFNDFLRGYNCTVLVYGMTSTGKTYTMTGDEKLYKGELSDSAGIIPRVLFKLFDTIEFQSESYVIKCSFIELYNEELKDLLIDSNIPNVKKLRIFDSNITKASNALQLGSNINNLKSKSRLNLSNAKRSPSPKNGNRETNNLNTQNGNASIYIQNLQEFHIKNAKEGIQLLQKGLKFRQVATTKMNDFSSRSHTIFTINLYKEHKGELFKLSKMNLVDLAGSENISRSGAQNQRAKEAGSINQSLLTLGRVINSVADKNIHIPFRESKLTRLLQDSLGGNTKTALIATISPAKLNSDETCSTLEYATKAKSIKNKPQLGSIIMKDVKLKDLINEVAKIKRDLNSTRQKDGVFMTQNHYKDLTNDLESYKTEIQECNRIMNTLQVQNSLLINDKIASYEVNNLQRQNLEDLTKTLEHIQSTLELQHKKEQNLVEELTQSREKSLKMKSVIKEYSEKEERIQNEMKSIFSDELIKLKELLVENLNSIDREQLISETSIEDNILSVKEEVTLIVTESQEKSKKLFFEFSQQILKETPIILDAFNTALRENQEQNDEYFKQLFENLETINKNYLDLRHYFYNNFFKTNHSKVVDEHINKTKKTIRDVSLQFSQQFQSNMKHVIEQNKNTILENLKSISSKLMKNEMTEFNKYDSKWNEAFNKVNHCDYLNNTYHDQMCSSITNMEGTLQSSRDMIKSHLQNIKSNIDILDETPKQLLENQAIIRNCDQITNKNVTLQNHLQDSLNNTQNSLVVFDEINTALHHAFDNYNKSNVYKSSILKERLFSDSESNTIITPLKRNPIFDRDHSNIKGITLANDDKTQEKENKLDSQNVTLTCLKRSSSSLINGSSPIKTRRRD